MAAFSFPTRMRGMAVGWSHAMIRIGSILGFYFFPLAIEIIGLQRMMLWLAIFPLSGLLAAASIRWDPLGMNIEQEDQTQRAQIVASAGAAKG